MENSKYYVIHNGEGDTTVDELTKEELLKRLNERWYGDIPCMKSVPEDSTDYWGARLLVIKGKVVTPLPVEKVTEYDVE